MTITIPLHDEQLEKINKLASRFDLSPEEIALISVEDMLSQPDEAFQRALDHVLEKNKALYQRLKHTHL